MGHKGGDESLQPLWAAEALSTFEGQSAPLSQLMSLHGQYSALMVCMSQAIQQLYDGCAGPSLAPFATQCLMLISMANHHHHVIIVMPMVAPGCLGSELPAECSTRQIRLLLLLLADLVCKQAIQRMEEECKADASKALLRCLMDPDANVLAAVLASPSMLQAPPEALNKALTSRLRAAWAQLTSGNKVTRKHAEAIAKKAGLTLPGSKWMLHEQKGACKSCLLAARPGE